MAKQTWSELAPVCIAMGTLTLADSAAFATLCELEATRRHASSQKDAEGFGMFTISQDYNGADKVGVHAAIKVERETAQALRPYYEKFGLEPAGRSRISVPKQTVVSKWEGLVQ
jgi:P27 family predicted phage terminase small subunit